ncbi:MAG: TraR/DksA family transcriptional regulator [Anaerolineae bacterium]
MGTERQKLEKERDRVVAEIEHLRSYLEHEAEIEVDEEEGDPNIFEREKNLALLQALERKLESINYALRTLEKGTYGICERCGQKIDPARLKALPDTTLCVKCKMQLERMSKWRIRPSY